jgi:hypothetical protein
MWTPLQMEMLSEAKSKADRAPHADRHRREARGTDSSIGSVSVVAASALRRAADRLDPTPPQAARI